MGSSPGTFGSEIGVSVPEVTAEGVRPKKSSVGEGALVTGLGVVYGVHAMGGECVLVTIFAMALDGVEGAVLQERCRKKLTYEQTLQQIHGL
jgi:hypothetical protein